MSLIRSIFDPNAVFRVRKPFLFSNRDLVAGDRFDPEALQASSRKVRNLWESRKIEVCPREDVEFLTDPAGPNAKQAVPDKASVEKTTGGWYIVKHPSLPPEGKKVQGQRSVDELLASLTPAPTEPAKPPEQTELTPEKPPEQTPETAKENAPAF